jgi:NAD(P)H-flavin reductase
VYLYIKVYEKGKLTQELDHMEVGSMINMKGPMGPGLMLTPGFSGTCAAFGGGTGIIPFLDLVDVINGRKKGRKSPLDAVKLNMYAGFGRQEDVFGTELLFETRDTCRDDFRLHMNVVGASDSDKPLDADVAKELVPADVARVWICGPSGFNKFVLDLLLETGVERGKIIVM